ncbi:polysaccharide biosynthesis C-terminal domain-containing protein [Arthrobacter cavernae]|uniref:Polysaccharide biosynthesis C-terminal domain-containing protein n=1 Tax=Arthrobacter cavernae TaxID=2817681 RepID=A0A939HG62_9MICC|nr:polysaccharide biosynthesis C-terminal domain-containing protein [Arthrobacter cavernae]MBO1267708.1 polysaccharide biosynthesis C-terminal domain-containing protein [Arthrobacter cavernae]
MIRRLLKENLISQNLLKAGMAASWIVAGRVMGLAWTTAMIVSLGISDYGRYAMALSFAAIIAAPLDNPFLVRSLRSSDALFRAERTGRALLGIGLFLAGLLAYGQFFVAGFALMVAGGEIAFNAFKSEALRNGHPNIIMRWDVVRQAASVAGAAAVVYLVPGRNLELVCLAYLAPYLVVVALAGFSARQSRPGFPGRFKEWALLWSDALIVALHIQGDILLLGLLTDSTVAGYYSVASVVVMAVASFGQMYAHTFHEPLRMAGGHPAAGPRARSIVILSGLFGLMVLLAGLALLATGIAPDVATALIILSAFTVLRCVTLVMTTVLYVQNRDGHRVVGGGLAAFVKLGLIAALAPLGAAGASLAAVAGEAVLAAWFGWAANKDLERLTPLEVELETVKESTP